MSYASSFSALAARQHTGTRLREFVADASHELRTPLAAVRGCTDMLQLTEPLTDTGRQSREGSTGLGLPIVRSVVQAHGGTVDVESRPGRTCFTVRLPLRAT